MDSVNVTILETFDPKFCCVCTQNSAPFYLKIFENVILYRQEYVSLAQIINETLGLTINRNSQLPHEICIGCKTKLIDFFIFKRKNEEARKMFREFSIFDNKSVKNLLLEVVDHIENCQEEICEDNEGSEHVQETEGNQEAESAEKKDHDDNESEVQTNDNESETQNNDNEFEQFLQVSRYSDDDNNFPEAETLGTDFDESSQLEATANTSFSTNSRRKSVRQAHPENWLRNRRKLAKNSGQSYVTSNGKFVEAKEMRFKCGESCRMQCSKKVSEENRFINFNHFYSLGDIEKQRLFLFEHIKTFEPKRKLDPALCQKPRAVQRSYYLDLIKPSGDVELVQVCRLMFLNTFVISSQMIDTLHRKAVTEGQFNDVRGKYPKKLRKSESLE